MNKVNENKNSGGEAELSLVSPEQGLAGRELDAAVAERVMGWEWWERPDDANGTWRKAIFAPMNSTAWVRLNFAADYWRPAQNGTEHFTDWDDCCRRVDRLEYGMPRYSTDIAAAWQLVEHFQKQGCMVSVNASSEINNWWCVVYPAKGGYFEEYGSTAPEAICKAALAHNAPARETETTTDD